MRKEDSIIDVREIKPHTIYFSKANFIVLLQALHTALFVYKKCDELPSSYVEDLDSFLDYIYDRC